MIYTDIEYPIPKRFIRLKKQNENTYVYYLTGRKGDKEGSERDISICVGKLSRNGYLFPNDNYFSLIGSGSDYVSIADLPKKDNQSKIGASLALKHIAVDNGLYDCLKLSFPDHYQLIFSLATYYTIARDSAAQLYSDFMFDHWIDTDDIASEATISRLLNERMDEYKIDSFRSSFLRHRFFINQNKRGRKKQKTILVDVDSTNINCSSKNLELAERGHPKVDEDLPQVNYAYFYDRNSGVPVFYDAFYGSITDITHCLYGINDFLDNLNINNKDVNYRFILDRGYFSSKNINYINGQNIEFAVMGKANVLFKQYVKDYGQKVRSSKNMIGPGKYGISFKGNVFSGDDEYFIYLFFDSDMELKEKFAIENSIMLGKKALSDKTIDRNGGLKRTYGKMFEIEETSKGKIKSFRLKDEVIDEAMSQCGYFWIISNVEVEPEEMLKAYRERDDIEKSFRFVKTESDLNKTYAQNDRALKAKIFMGYLTAILRSELVNRTRSYVKLHTSMTTQKILLSLDKIIIKKSPGGYTQKYAFTAQQLEIMNSIGMDKKDVDKTIHSINKTLKNNRC